MCWSSVCYFVHSLASSFPLFLAFMLGLANPLHVVASYLMYRQDSVIHLSISLFGGKQISVFPKMLNYSFQRDKHI